MDRTPLCEPVRRRIGDTEIELRRVFEGDAALRRLIRDWLREQRPDGSAAAPRREEDA